MIFETKTDAQLRQFYRGYADTYLQRTGTCWSFREFSRRAREDQWIFLGQPDGFIVVKQERLYPILKLVIGAGNSMEMMGELRTVSDNHPLWCATDARLGQGLVRHFDFSVIQKPDTQLLLIPDMLENYLNTCVDRVEGDTVHAILPEIGIREKRLYLNPQARRLVGQAACSIAGNGDG